MAGLGGGGALPFGVGGPTALVGRPFIVNIFPIPESTDVRIFEPIRMTIRDMETFIDPTTVNVDVGYAKVFGAGTQRFDYFLPRTFLDTILQDPVNEDALIEVIAEGVKVTKTADSVQRSVFFTPIDSGTLEGFPSGMAMFKVKPEGVTSEDPFVGALDLSIMPGHLPVPFSIEGEVAAAIGGVIGLENGPRNTGVYVFFDNIGSISEPIRILRITGPDVGGTRVPDTSIVYNWDGFHRYFLVWNEVISKVELFADFNAVTFRIASIPISSFQQFGESGTPRRGGSRDFVAIYGQEGPAGDRIIIKNVAVTNDVGYPFIGGARPGDFISIRKSAEVVGFSAEDPRKKPIETWFDAPETHFASRDPQGQAILNNGVFRLTKNTLLSTFGVYREEPGFKRGGSEGFVLEAKFFAIDALREDTGTGMGFCIYDGQSAIFLNLINDGINRTVGVLKKSGSFFQAAQHYLPTTPLKWSSPITFRFVIDTRRGKMELFQMPDTSTPIMSVVFDRSALPSAADFGFSDKTPFIAIGHLAGGNTLGSIDIHHLKYSHFYNAWERRDSVLPTAADPMYTLTTQGSGTGQLVTEGLEIDTPGQDLFYYHREGVFDPFRGAIVEFKAKITDFKPRSITGVYAILDDGLKAYMLTFMETDVGKYAGLSVTSGLNDFAELMGPDGQAKFVSFPVDWSQFHTYRMERRPDDGLYVFVDTETKPRLVIRDRDNAAKTLAGTRQSASFPNPYPSFPVPASPTGTVAFGHLRGEGATSVWEFIRHTFSTGFELSATKAGTPQELREELLDTQALVVAYASDKDS